MADIDRPRLKVLQSNQGSATFNNVWTFKLLNGIAIGDNNLQRDGDSIVMHSVRMRMRFTTSAATGSSFLGRVLILYDKQPNGAVPAVTDLFVLSQEETSSFKIAFDKRFIILYDRMFQVGEYAANSTVNAHKVLDVTIPLAKRKSQYETDGNGVSDISTGALYAMWFTNRSDQLPSLSGSWDLRWHSSQN